MNADTSSEPEGLTRRVMLNILEAFFRRPWLHLLPLILMVALGAVTALSADRVYRSTGTIIAASSTAIEEITNENAAGIGFETPAALAARNINEQLRTDRFVDLVAELSGLSSSEAQAALLRQEIRTRVGAVDDGDSLVRISAATGSPQLSQQLASATLEAYRQTILDRELRQTEESEAFLQTQVDEARQALTTAETELDQYLLDNPVASETDRPPTELVRVERLTAQVDRAELRHNTALDALDQAKLRAAQAEIDLEQRLELQDEPQPGSAAPRFKKAALTGMVFVVLGLLLSLASVIIAATLDRSIRLPNDITAKFGLDVLAVVPNARAR